MNIPPQAWIMGIAVLGVSCAVIGYVVPGDPTSKQAMFHSADTLIGAAVGAFVGNKIANSNIGDTASSERFPKNQQ